jgi:hypothetical protein
MFEQRLAGRSVASIARELTEQGVPCPSDVDPDRNRHRAGGGWPLRTVAVILANPRYTGRQVWDRQRTGRDSDRLSHRSAPAGDWVISASAVHPALVSEAQFVAAQRVRAARPTGDGARREYPLSGLVRCAVCGRRLDSHWVHGRAGYRCRHGRNSARPLALEQAKRIYVREDVLLHELTCRLLNEQDWASSDAVSGMVASMRGAGMLITDDGMNWTLTAGDV